MSHSFFALISRMRYITRWGLMRNSIAENVQEHSHMVAVLAHALAVIRRDVFLLPANPSEAAAMALFHDASEILTGDLPTPIKYNNAEIISAYRGLERVAAKKLLTHLPEELRGSYSRLLAEDGDRELHAIVKAADKLAAYIKCVEERKAGNCEFLSAERQCLDTLRGMNMPELNYFIEKLLPAFEMTLDEAGASIN